MTFPFPHLTKSNISLFVDIHNGVMTRTRFRLYCQTNKIITHHYSDVIMGTMESQITGVSIVYSTVCSGADQRKHQSFASLAFVRGIHRWRLNSPLKGPVTQKMFPFDDVIVMLQCIVQTNKICQNIIKQSPYQQIDSWFIVLDSDWVLTYIAKYQTNEYKYSAQSMIIIARLRDKTERGLFH